MNNTSLYLSVVAVLLAGFVFLSQLTSGGSFGASPAANLTIIGNPFKFTNTVQYTSTSQLGVSGTARSNVVITTCSLKADNSITATTSGYAYCTGATGITSSDYVLASFSTSTALRAITDNWIIFNAKASSTAGTVDLWLYNATGNTRAPSASSQIGSTTVLYATH